MDRWEVDQVIIVQNQGKLSQRLRYLVNQACHHIFHRGWLGSLECHQESLAKIGLEYLEGCDKVGQKTDKVIIGLIQRYPANTTVAVGDPFGQEGGFAKASRG